RVHERWDPKADGTDLAVGRLTDLLHRFNGYVDQRGLVQPGQAALGPVVNRQLAVNRPGEQLRAAHVDADDAPGGHAVTILVVRGTAVILVGVPVRYRALPTTATRRIDAQRR